MLPLAAFAFALLVPVAAPADTATPTIGDAAPDFEAISLHGEIVSLRDATARKQTVVLVFLSTVCPYANYFAQHIRDLADTYGPRGVRFIGIYSNRWESGEAAATHGRGRGFAFPLVKDLGHLIADRLGATRTPEAFVVDGQGRLRYRGRIMSKQESPELRRALDAVLEGRVVRRPITKAFGCAIDRS